MYRPTYLILAMAVSLLVVVDFTSANRFAKLDENPYPIFCDQAKPRKCAHDFTPHCLKGRKEPVFGHCEFQNAICDDGAQYDSSFSCELH